MFFRWQVGRQGTGYQKLQLATGRRPIPFDVYLLRFPEGVSVPPHQDPVANGRHYRLNVILRPAERGGRFECEQVIFRSPRVILFRPDQYAHSVSRVERGVRYVLSLGWVLGAGKPARNALR